MSGDVIEFPGRARPGGGREGVRADLDRLAAAVEDIQQALAVQRTVVEEWRAATASLNRGVAGLARSLDLWRGGLDEVDASLARPVRRPRSRTVGIDARDRSR
jgi:hypothetical protein